MERRWRTDRQPEAHRVDWFLNGPSPLRQEPAGPVTGLDDEREI